MLYTADAQGRQFDEIVNAIGDEAMRRILGAGGHNLQLMEAPHHFGEQSGPDACGLPNMLQLAYESGEGSLRVVAQTTQAFTTTGSSTFTFLDTAGVSPERIESDPSGRDGAGDAGAGQFAGESRARPDRLAASPASTAGQRHTPTPGLQAARRTGPDARGRWGDAIGAYGSGLARAIAAIPGADRRRPWPPPAGLADRCGKVWDQMRAAAVQSGMRSSADLTQVTAALTALGARESAQGADLTRCSNDLETTRASLTLYERLATNAVRMIRLRPGLGF
jgi:hypothetical protein